MNVKHRIVGGAVLTIGAALAVFVWSRTGSDAALPNPGQTRDRVVQRDRAPALLPPGSPAPATEPEAATDEEPKPGDDYYDNPLAEALLRVLAKDPQLKAFKYYHHRPLLDEGSLAKYHAMLSDPAVFAIVKHDLLYPAETKVDQESEFKRLMKIDYLREAAEWKENPRRDELIGLITSAILTDNYPPGMGMDMRLSLSGNKRELFALLEDVAPDQAGEILAASRGTRLEPLIAYVSESVARSKRLEAQDNGTVHPGPPL